ncbi:MAG TPA: thermonuclease family protein [Alphaproteobacteria bacterium]|nr:thermonuclease family protein [Alphaproteobacteria bacterium]
MIGTFHLHTRSSSSTVEADAPRLTGVASVIDGDTLDIHGRRIRLHGIDAPESKQLCTLNGAKYRCGQMAALALSDFVGRGTVSCAQRDTDRYGRAVATCSVAGQDIGAWLVSHGHALAYRKYSRAYVQAEESAAAARVGIWAGEFEEPWEWRRK